MDLVIAKMNMNVHFIFNFAYMICFLKNSEMFVFMIFFYEVNKSL